MAEFLQAFASSGNALAPVSGQLGELVTGGAATFGALARERSALVGMIDAAPRPRARQPWRSRAFRPALDGLAQLTRQLEPAGRLLPARCPSSTRPLTAGVTPLRRLPAFTGDLRRALLTLSLSAICRPPPPLRKLSDLMASLDQTLAALTPAQVHCNVIGLFAQVTRPSLGCSESVKAPHLRTWESRALVPRPTVSSPRSPPLICTSTICRSRTPGSASSGNEPYTPGTQDLSNPPGPLPDHARATYPPPGVLARARAVGLLDPGSPRR